MFKKLVSSVCLWALLGSVIPMQALAGFATKDLIKSVTLTVDGSSPQTFEPSAATPQVLKTAVVFDTTTFGTELSTSTGYVRVMQGTKIVKILANWGNPVPSNVPTSIPNWDGKSIENSTEAFSVCGGAGAVCLVGTYQIVSHVEFTSGANTSFDDETSAFKIFETPAVAISGLAVSPNSFNPPSQTADISFTTSNAGFITAEILDGTTSVRTLINNENLSTGAYSKANKSTLAWDGKDNAGQLLTNKNYTVQVTSRQTATGSVLDTKTVSVTVNASATLIFNTYNLTQSPQKTLGVLDPSPKGENQDLVIDYTLNKAPDNVSVDIKDSKSKVVKTLNLGNGVSGTQSWDGISTSGKIVPPGTYTAVITASKSGEIAATNTKTFEVIYGNIAKGAIANLSVSPTSFDPDFEDAVIEFKNTIDAEVTVKIEDSAGNEKRNFAGYNGENRSANTLNPIAWNGKDTGGSTVLVGTYKVIVITRNEYGVVMESRDITVNDAGGSVSNSNSQVSGISFSPSTTFKPGEDDQLKIEFDALQKLDALQIFASSGAQKIELYSEENVAQENNLEVTWDGTDSAGDYVNDGSWRIAFKSRVGTTSLTASKTITIAYEKPEIDDLELSKTKIDNEHSEFTNILFRLDKEATVNIKVLVNGQDDDDIVEDMDVNANQWYAVQWDGSGSNYSDNIDIKLIAANKANENIFDSEKIKLDLAEDPTLSNRANITNDYIDPAITNGNENLVLHYNLDDYGDVQISILRGNSTSGSTVTTLADLNDVEASDHEIVWNGKDDNGKKLTNGFYTYKIVSKKNSTDTEYGLFVVGNIGDSGFTSGTKSGSGKKTTGKVSPNVIIDGGDKDVVEEEPEVLPEGPGGDVPEEKPDTSIFAECAGFTDVTMKNQYCEAITWTKEEEIFKGYDDGSFGVNSPIMRVELLKVIMEALDIKTQPAIGTVGFKDVEIGKWYMPYIQGGKNFGIFNGDAGKGTARPLDSSQRVEALKMIFESLKTAGAISQIGMQCSVTHPDVINTVWYGKYVCEADNLGLYDVEDGDIFGTNTLSTRGEIAEVLYRLHLQDLF